MSTVRIWAAGSRSWENPKPIEKMIRKLIANYGIARLLLMTGGAPGVDYLVEEVSNKLGVHVFRCRACWPVGRQAGPVRNEVIAKEFSPRVLLALHYWELTGTNHKGTRSAIDKARKYGIPVKTIHVPVHVALPSSVAPESPMGNRARAEAGLPPRAKKPRKRRA